MLDKINVAISNFSALGEGVIIVEKIGSLVVGTLFVDTFLFRFFLVDAEGV